MELTQPPLSSILPHAGVPCTLRRISFPPPVVLLRNPERPRRSGRQRRDESDPPAPVPCTVTFTPAQFHFQFHSPAGVAPVGVDPCGKARRRKVAAARSVGGATSTPADLVLPIIREEDDRAGGVWTRRIDRELAEQTLAHAAGSQVEQCYARSDVLERRREVMEDLRGVPGRARSTRILVCKPLSRV